MSDAAVFGPWEPFGVSANAVISVCTVGRMRIAVVRSRNGRFEARVGNHWTRQYDSLDEVMPALRRMLLRYIKTEEERLKNLQQAVLNGLTPPVWEDNRGAKGEEETA